MKQILELQNHLDHVRSEKYMLKYETKYAEEIDKKTSTISSLNQYLESCEQMVRPKINNKIK